MNNISVLVVDDEFFNRSLITMLIPQLNPHFTIKGQAANIDEAYQLIKELKPDVVFLDIKMPDGSGFDLLKKFTTIAFEVVFVTGFDEYTLKAFDFNALDYVLKPIDLDKLTQTLETITARVQHEAGATEAIAKKIPIHTNGNVVLLNIDEIMYIQAEGLTTVFAGFPDKRYVSEQPLTDLSIAIIDFKDFVRVNTDTYINLKFMTGYTKTPELMVTMRDSANIRISEQHKAGILEFLEQLSSNQN